MKLRKNQGFTLLELMIVVIIGGILTVLALPAFRTYIARSNLTQAANGALIAFNTAREEAIKRNTYVRVDPVTCNGVASWAYGAFVWVPATPTATPPAGANPAATPTLPIISGFPTASGGACTDGNKITATPSDTTMTVCYNGSGRVALNTAGAACTGSSTTASAALDAGTSQYTVKLCDSQLTVPTGQILNLSLSGRVSITPNVSCP